jgi:ribonuclease VapC
VILDTSALVAVFQNEPEASECLELLANADQLGISAVSVLESGIVLSHRTGSFAQHALDTFLSGLEIEVIVFDDDHRRSALRAWWRFGKSRSPAGLNFGDCIAYATAELAGRPLLCKGSDFPKTDLPIAVLGASTTHPVR